MTSRDLVKLLRSKGCSFLRQAKGSHEIWACPGGCTVSIPMHTGDIPNGTLRGIMKTLEPCLGKDWWK
jgi:predicted RNA binding protein YcfA (HicA-like mRNA interferase family)